jgi:AcrR family transcriptional regulator
MVTAQPRMSAIDRRQQVISAALEEFALGGLAGTSTEDIATRAGISQPYLFRLFGTKHELFIASARRCFDNVLETFEVASQGLTGEDAMGSMGVAYGELIQDRKNLLAQLQMYAACEEPGVRECARDGFRRLYTYVQNATGAPPEKMLMFFAIGMLCNVSAAMRLGEVDEPWAKALIDINPCFPDKLAFVEQRTSPQTSATS